MRYIFWFILVPALLPVAILLWYVYQKDKYEREPIGLVLKVVFMGALFSLLCIPIENMMETILYTFYGDDALRYEFIENMIGIALVEEFIKFAVIMLFVWRANDFDFRYDGIVYSVSSALGFAGLENILYIVSFGTGISLSRAIFSIPGHAAFGVFMGFFLSRAKDCELRGKGFAKMFDFLLALAVPTFVHGLYDFLLSDVAIELGYNSGFILLVLVIDFLAWRVIKHEFKTDRPLGEDYQ